MTRPVTLTQSATLSALFALGLLSGCGDIENVDLGDFRCASTPCEANFGVVNLNRPGRPAKVEVTNIGNGLLELLELRITLRCAWVLQSEADGDGPVEFVLFDMAA